MVHAKETPKMELVTPMKNAKPKEAQIRDLVRPDTEFVAHVINYDFFNEKIPNLIFVKHFSYCQMWSSNKRKLHLF